MHTRINRFSCTDRTAWNFLPAAPNSRLDWSLMFKILSDGNRGTGRGLFASMHRLRHKIFIEEQRWPLGDICSLCGMERDDFDVPSALYIVRVNGQGDVDACMRLLPTSGPYLLGMKFGDLIQKIPKPNSPWIWEVSRLCADRNAAASWPAHGRNVGVRSCQRRNKLRLRLRCSHGTGFAALRISFLPPRRTTPMRARPHCRSDFQSERGHTSRRAKKVRDFGPVAGHCL